MKKLYPMEQIAMLNGIRTNWTMVPPNIHSPANFVGIGHSFPC